MYYTILNCRKQYPPVPTDFQILRKFLVIPGALRALSRGVGSSMLPSSGTLSIAY